ncbi:MAG: adenylate/guanylate cyclase domain-containing protein [Acidimicrobiia bacterium]
MPTGTVTFMFTDIEDSTLVLRNVGDSGYSQILERHYEIIRDVLARCNGLEVATEGDSVFAVFEDPAEAVAAGIDIQLALASETWSHGGRIRVRIGIHTGNGVLGAANYVGVDVHRAARVASAAHGGQVLVSSTTAQTVGDHLPLGSALRNLGSHRLPGFDRAEMLHQLIAQGLEEDFPPPAGAVSRSKLPDVLSEFVGRERELARGENMVRASRLVTLTGPGGTGKTRLSIELGRRLEADFDDGAYFIPLATIHDPDLIPSKILEGMGLETAAAVDPTTHLQRYLAERSVLLILDNFEHLLEGVSIVAALLGSATGLRVVATSRIPLRVAGEQEFPVPSLEVPDHSARIGEDLAPSVRLFASRASAVRPDFELTNANIATVSSITRSLDGLPLAIELAASRMRSLTPEVILERLNNHLLASSSTELPERQRSMVNAIGWSYDFLEEPERRLFEKLSVFAGTFSLDQAEAVCDIDGGGVDVLDGLTALVESSLIHQIQTSGTPRFRMLTVIREYGYAALVARGIESEIQERHAEVLLRLAEMAHAEILTSRQRYWLDRLSADHDNLRAAMDHSIHQKDITVALRFAGCLWRFWQIRGHLVEGRRRTEEALGLGDGGDRLARANVLTGLAGLMYWQGDSEGTLHPYQEALELFRQFGEEGDVSDALYNMSFPLMYSGDVDGAEKLLEESLEISQRIGRRIGIGRAYWGLGEIAVFRQQWTKSVEWNLRAVEVFDSLDAPFDLGWSWFMAAHGYSKQNLPEEAAPYLERCLEVFAGTTDVSALALVFDALSLVALRRGDTARAGRLVGAAHRIKADTGVAIVEVEINQYPEAQEFLREMSEADHAAYQEGLGYTIEEAIAYARDVGGEG